MSRTLRSATKGLPRPISVSPRSPFSAAAIACLQSTLLPPDVTTRMQVAVAAAEEEDEIDEEPDEYDKGYQYQEDLDSDSDDEEDDNDEDGADV